MLKDENGPKYGFYRNPADTAKFFKEFYDEAGVSPRLVNYVEAFGSAVPEVDKSELEAIDTVFCSDRKEPLLVGSVMSNIGFGDAASGISAVTKVLLGYHNGSLAGNLHCEVPRRDVAALREGRMRVLADHQRFGRTYTAVNSMSVTGVNGHVLLHGHYKPKDLDRYKANIPRLVTISGRKESAVASTLDHLKSHPIDPEELALLHNIHENNTAGHLGKGYIILDTNPDGNTYNLSQRVEYCDEAQRPLWFVYSGMGSQWAGMGAQLMRIPIFAAAIERCRKVLEPRGLDIVHIITSSDPTIFNNILHSFVGIATVQIGLTDILLQLGLVPDKIIGHSVGELGCAYADGCLTAEEMILSAYSRGCVSLETPFIHGSMAAVGVGAQQMSSMCPTEIEIACHNSAESCTISGPADTMRSFVADLTARGIFAKEVPCSNIAYHSRYIAEAGPGLLKYLKDVISTPRARSERWVSSSVPQDRWDEPAAKYSSAEYHTNNLLSPVLFEEASALIPADAVLVEVAPHGLLQAILKRALPDSATNIPLTRRGHTDNVIMLLKAIGSLYIHGYLPKVRVLYPQIEFPVSTGTPFLSHFVKWTHQETWPYSVYQSSNKTTAASCTFVVTIHDNGYYMEGHVIKNKTLLPFSYALVAAWDTLAMSLDVPKKSLDVEFRDVKLYTQPILHEQKIVRLSVSLHRGNGRFEIMEDNSKVASGFIFSVKTEELDSNSPKPNGNKDKILSTQDVYRILYSRGYYYSGAFRSIHSADESISDANISWNDNWVTFIDGLIQLNTLKYTHSGVSHPAYIGKININVKQHYNSIHINKDNGSNMTSSLVELVEVQLSEVQNRTRTGGIVVENIRFNNVLLRNDDRITLKTSKFVPRFCSTLNASRSLHVLIQIASENIHKETMNAVGLIFGNIECTLFEDIEKIAKKGIPGIKLQYNHILNDNDAKDDANMYQNMDLIITKNLSKNKEIGKSFYHMLQPNTFIINEEDITGSAGSIFPSEYNIISIMKNAKTQLELGYWRPTPPLPLKSTFTVHSDSDLPLLINTRNDLPSQNSLLIITSYPPVAGVTSLVKQWRRDSTRNNIYVVMIDPDSRDNFNKSVVVHDIRLALNVFNNGLWGGEYYLPLEETSGVRDKVTLKSVIIGDLGSLQWVQAPELTGPGTAVMVHYTGINIGDVKRALGLTLENNQCCNYGMEFSGTTERGDRVMGLVPSGAASSYIMAQPELTWPVPSHWSLEDAATVPFAYIYAYYCLVITTAMRPLTTYTMQSGYSVLIHGGAGALGQAAISISLARGWRVFTTVGDCDKKRFLMRLFPQLNEKDIGNSRDGSFYDMIQSATNGMGCNAVICCLKGDLKDLSFKCCGTSSVAIDTAQILDNENYTYGMFHLTSEISYVAVDITRIFGKLKTEEINMLHALVSEGIARGEVRPLTRVTFAPNEVPRAFRLLAVSRHRGRVLLRRADERIPAQFKVSAEAAAPCYIIICDSSAFGFQLADRLINSGIKKLHLHCDAPARFTQYNLRAWKNRNVQVSVSYESLEEINNIFNLLHSAKKLGPVEGLVVITESSQETVIKRIDLSSRNICPSLKHFIALSKNDRCGYNTCYQRIKSGLPATLLDLSMLETLQDVDGGTWYRDVNATVAVERALQTTDLVLLPLPERTPSRSLVQQIATVTGLNIDVDTPNSTSLEQLGMQKEKSALVSAVLKEDYNVFIDDEYISQITIESLEQIQNRSTVTQYKQVNGLEIFYSFVDSDELLATTDMVFLPTLTNSYIKKDDEFHVNETFLCIVPGLEGHHERFRALCERLKLPAFVLQPGLDHPRETPSELALRYSKILLKKTSLKNTFYILGYETGVLVALELAAILEEHGLTGTVYCLGDGPVEIAALLERELSAFPDAAALQEAVVRHMFALMARGSGADVERALRGCFSWSERVDACVRSLLGHVSHSAQYARALMEAAYARVEAARRAVEVPHALRSRLVLLRARSKFNDMRDICSLQRYSQQPLHVRDLVAPMAHAAADLRISAIVNSYLDDDILDVFEKRNLCDTYIRNTNEFKVISD